MYLSRPFFIIEFIFIIYFYHVNNGYEVPEESKTCSGAIYVKENIFEDRTKRDIFINRWANWTKDIKYYIHKNVYRTKIISVFKYLMRETCLKFEESMEQKINESLIEFIFSTTTCSSEVGKWYNNSNTKTLLTDSCSHQFGTVGHEILHALGVGHEHQRYDRDKYLDIYRANIGEGSYDQIVEYSNNVTKRVYFDIPYDYGSIMHYRSHSHSKNNKNTMEAKYSKLYNKMMGHESIFSFNDVKLLNYYYCRKECLYSERVCKNGGYVIEPNCLQCKCPKEYEGDKCNFVKDRSFSCKLETLIPKENYTMFSSSGIKRCVYHIKATKRRRIKLFLKIVQTLEKDYCLSDTGLEVKYLNDKGTTGLCLCGSYKNIFIVSEGSEVLLTYTGLASYHNFVGEYKEIPKSSKEKNRICYEGECYQDPKERINEDESLEDEIIEEFKLKKYKTIKTTTIENVLKEYKTTTK
uniref:Metalloendopeptidase n=1 Tax=Parastrongyloides trichosuri TaxID=131310 RepID=A0A0N5A5S4_PARTI